MPRLTTTATTTATTEVDIEPALRKKLQTRLTIYSKLKETFESAKASLEKEKRLIDGYFEQAGANSINIEGHATITQVNGTSSKLDKKLFVQNGGSLKMLEDSTVTTPKKPYVLITFAKEEK